MFTIDLVGLSILIGLSALSGLLVGVLLMLFRTSNDPSTPKGRDIKEIFRLWRDQSSGALILVFGKRTIENADDLNPHQRNQLTLLIYDLINWLGIRLDEFALGRPKVLFDGNIEEILQKTEKPQPHEIDQVMKPGSPEKVEPPALHLDPEIQPESTVRVRPRISPVRVVEQLLGTEPPASEITRPVSIVGQVDEILQRMIKDTELVKRGIKLIDVLGGGMQVIVGIEKYESILDVPDEEIRLAIQAAAAEWEKGTTR